jgi:cytoskeletal protein CcmA (bactofilin family)
MDVRGEGNIQGEIVARRVCIGDGAILKGSVEIERPDKNKQPAEKDVAGANAEGSVPTAPPPSAAEEAKPEPAQPEVLAQAVARRVAGSSVLWKPVR